MKNLKRALLFVLMSVFAATLAGVPAHAQSENPILVNVPFDFVAGTSRLSAGAYRFEKLESGVLVLNSTDRKKHVFELIVGGGKAASSKGAPHVVFTRYKDEAFLSKVFFSDDNNYDLLPGNKEKDLIAGQAVGQAVAVVSQSR